MLREEFANPYEHQASLFQSDEPHPAKPNPGVTPGIVGENDLIGRQRDSEAVREEHEGAWRPVSDNRKRRNPVLFQQERRRGREVDEQRNVLQLPPCPQTVIAQGLLILARQISFGQFVTGEPLAFTRRRGELSPHGGEGKVDYAAAARPSCIEKTMPPETPATLATPVSDRAWRSLEGAYDLQVHVGPDVIARRIDDIDCAREFLERGMKGFVLKSHYMQTGERAHVVAKAVPGSHVFGAITLNHSVGGLNPVAVELAGRTGCKIVWFPTVDAENETAGRLDGGSARLPFWAAIQRELAAEGISPPPLSVVDQGGDLIEPARRCLERIAKHNMILATGHLGRQEIFALVRGARARGVKKIVVTHAEFPSQSLTGDEQKELADLGAIIEHCFTTTYTNKAPWDVAFANIRKAGVHRAVISTDLGQTVNPPVAEGFGMFAQRLLDAGFSADDVRMMAVTNPTRLLES